MEISDAISICIRKGVKVYPIIESGFFLVEISRGKTVKKGTIKHTTKTINKAIEQTYIYYAEKLAQVI